MEMTGSNLRKIIQVCGLIFFVYVGYSTFSLYFKDVKTDLKEMESAPKIAQTEPKYQQWHIKNGKINIFVTCLEGSSPSDKAVLFLHGMKFSSQNWKDIGTFVELGKQGYKVIAIDLPGYGQSPATTMNKAEVLEEVLNELKIEKVILVSPSMSGTFSIPFVLKYPERLSGFVPVAPVIEKEYTKEKFTQCTVPTLIVYGEKDTMAPRSTEILSAISPKLIKMIPNAGHPCYLDDPKLFHETFIKFFNLILKK